MEEINIDGKLKKGGFDYKWVVVGVCFLVIMITLGFCNSTKSLYLDIVTKALGIERSLFSLNETFRFLTTAVVNFFFGATVAKFGAKKLMLAGILSMSTAMMLYATATNLFMFYLGGMLLGVGFSWTGTTMVGVVVNKWCRESRGTIMGAVLAASGLGGAIAIQILAPIVESGGENYRNAYFISGVAVLSLAVIVLIFMKEAPKNYETPKNAHTKKKSRGITWAGIEYKSARRLPYFYIALVCIFFTGFCLQGIGGIAKAHMRDIGLDAEFVAYALSFHSLSLAFFKFLTGILYDKLGLRVTMTTCCTTAVVVIFLLAIITDSPIGMAIAIIYSVFSSLALPLETIMLPIYASDLFGEASYEKILGFFVSVNVLGYAFGVPIVNLCYDIIGTYTPILIVSSVIMLAVTIVMQYVVTTSSRQRRKIAGEEK